MLRSQCGKECASIVLAFGAAADRDVARRAYPVGVTAYDGRVGRVGPIARRPTASDVEAVGVALLDSRVTDPRTTDTVAVECRPAGRAARNGDPDALDRSPICARVGTGHVVIVGGECRR